MKIEIERGIPIPTERNGGLRGQLVSCFSKMKIGDSVFVKDKTSNFLSHYISTFRKEKGNTNKKFTCRTIIKPNGTRIWRIK